MPNPSSDSSSMLMAIIESAPVAMILSARDGGIRLVNREAESLFGYRRDELIGKSIDLLVPQPFRETHATLRGGFFAEPKSRKMGNGRELTGLRKDGSMVPIEIALTPIDGGDGILALSVVLDITQRRLLEADVHRAHEELEQRVLDRTAELEIANREKEALLVDLDMQRARFERLSREDPLTQIANRREFDQRTETEIQRAMRQKMPLSAAMLDLDLFKQVNDRFGHALGDAVLRTAASLIRRECRSIDVVARYGGEEFALALPGADLSAAAALCERIRVAFEQFDWSSLHAGLSLTISAGVVAWRRGLNPQALLALADANLYEAKRGGRNRVVPGPAGVSPPSTANL